MSAAQLPQLHDGSGIAVFALANLAGCASPDSLSSPGAEWLRQVGRAALETWEDTDDRSGDDWSDEAHELADQLVPVYTHDLWSVFVDLAGYQVDTQDYGTPEDMTQGASWALYEIARSLVWSLFEDWAGEESDA